jgi:hypothetical protein
VSWLALGKVFLFFFVFCAEFFLVLCVTIANYILKFGGNLSFFGIFNRFILFLGMFLDKSNVNYKYINYRNPVLQKMILMVLSVFLVRIQDLT